MYVVYVKFVRRSLKLVVFEKNETYLNKNDI